MDILKVAKEEEKKTPTLPLSDPLKTSKCFLLVGLFVQQHKVPESNQTMAIATITMQSFLYISTFLFQIIVLVLLLHTHLCIFIEIPHLCRKNNLHSSS